MIKIRSSMFETNSSSVHSIIIEDPAFAPGEQNGLKPSELPVNKDGYIVGEYGVFDCYGAATTQEEKLSYLLTCMYYLHDMEHQAVLESDNFAFLTEVLKKYTGCKGLYINTKKAIKIQGEEEDEDYDYTDAPYIDHQSAPWSESEMLVDLQSEFDIINFIFNDYIWLEMSRD